MIFSVMQLVQFISTHMLRLPGDVICTGSPSGNGVQHKRVVLGDVLEGEIEGLGAQRVQCVAEELGHDAVLHRPFTPLGSA